MPKGDHEIPEAEPLHSTATINLPYDTGNILNLLFTPDTSELYKDNPDLIPITATIIKPFLPFTLSQVVLVRLDQAHGLGLPEVVVFKLYDRRFVKRTFEDWTVTQERSFRQYVADLECGLIAEDRPGDKKDEEWVQSRICERSFTSEAEAYRHLFALQGHCVPKCYGGLEGRIEAWDEENKVACTIDSSWAPIDVFF